MGIIVMTLGLDTMTDEHGNDMTLPHYGGNKIPQWYLDKFNPPKPEYLDTLPAWMAQMIEREFGR